MISKRRTTRKIKNSEDPKYHTLGVGSVFYVPLPDFFGKSNGIFEVVEQRSGFGCRECSFNRIINGNKLCRCLIVPFCAPGARDDNKRVIFKEI